MSKLLLVSVLFATVVLPLRAALDRSPRRGLKRTFLYAIAFNVLYVLAVIFIYPRIA